jgi:hypothetical protein
MISSGCDVATAKAKFVLIPVCIELLEFDVALQTGIGVNMMIARISRVKVSLLIAGIIESPSMAPASGDKIRLFLSATLC